MKHPLLITFLALLFVANAHAQNRIYRCGNVYTNEPPKAELDKAKCRLIENDKVTVVKADHAAVQASAKRVAAANETTKAPDQKARDQETRQILESELRKAESRREELVKEYNDGEPERLGPETRNNQKYLDRVAELKASISRTENDIAVLQRELARLPQSK